MNNVKHKNMLGLSIVTAVILGTNLYAGKIITDAPEGTALETVTSTPGLQFGFGGWNLENIEVLITDAEYTNPQSGLFDEDTGAYSGMGDGKTFESRVSTGGEVRGNLHGKDWPVGEPAGIKVINGDLKTKHSKPQNCIMTTSYLEEGFLNAGNKPVLCSSGFQTHKRFKINMLPSSTNGSGAWGNPIDLIFNLAADDTTTQRYQVFQKVNNYTGKRLDGYKIEVLDESGSVNPNLTLSIGIGEGDDGSDIWAANQLSNFAHGLWGAASTTGPEDQRHFDQDGFFDNIRTYYDVSHPSPSVLSHVGPLLGGNYQAIFGNWLPSIWEPLGVFHDEDMDPGTDNILKAFWGDPLNTGTDAWRKGKADNWALVTEEDLLLWSGEWYAQGPIEDVLNLGLNYIIVIGDNTQIGDKFTLRITPHVDSDQTAPTYVANPAPPSAYGDTGTVADTSEGIVAVELLGSL